VLKGCVVVYVLCEAVVSGCDVFHSALYRPKSQDILIYEPGLAIRLCFYNPTFEIYIV
jgi:hypothetical protein